MRPAISLMVLFMFTQCFVCAQDTGYVMGKLVKANEDVVMSFKTKNKKIVVVSEDKNHKYLVFRYGDKDSIKFQYPQELNESSWSKFKYYSFVKNDNSYEAAQNYKLSFFYNGISYTIGQYKHLPTEDEDLELNITGIVDGCVLSGKPHTRIGSLSKLEGSTVPKDIMD